MQPFRFLNLPPEIRNMVYKELLTCPGCDVLIKGVKEKHLSKVWIRPEQMLIKTCVDFALPVVTTIFETCKQIRDESGTIFYSSNRFSVRNITALRSLLKQVRRIHWQIRSIMIHGMTNNTMIETVVVEVDQILVLMPDLRSLEIRCNDMSEGRIRMLLTSFSDLVTNLLDRHKSSAGIFRCVQLFQDKPCSSHTRGYDGQCRDCLAANVDFHAWLPGFQREAMIWISSLQRKEEEQRNERLQKQTDLIAKKEAEPSKLKQAI